MKKIIIDIDNAHTVKSKSIILLYLIRNNKGCRRYCYIYGIDIWTKKLVLFRLIYYLSEKL